MQKVLILLILIGILALSPGANKFFEEHQDHSTEWSFKIEKSQETHHGYHPGHDHTEEDEIILDMVIEQKYKHNSNKLCYNSSMPKATTYITDALIISKRDWRSHDRLYTVITPEGKKELRAIGCRRPQSKLVGRMEPWQYTKLMVVHGRINDILADSQTYDHFEILHSHLPSYLCAAWYTELIDIMIPLGEPNSELYEVILNRYKQLQDMAMESAKEGKAYKAVWRLWVAEASAEILSLSGLLEENAKTTDFDSMYWYVVHATEKPLQTFSLIRAIL